MSEEQKQSTLKEHEKFWAFIVLVGVITGLVLLASYGLNSNADNPATDVVYAAKLRIIDAAVAGLLTIAGMAAQALFRVSATDKLSAETALEAARKLPTPPTPPAPEPQKVEVVNTPANPAIVEETPRADDDAGLPENLR
jgi:di/tricarboxylate transporter